MVVFRLFRRVRQFFESIAYAGLQPGTDAQRKPRRWLGPLQRPVERLLFGGPAPTDPLYLTNRTIGTKLKIAMAIGFPCLLLAAGLYGVLADVVDFGAPKPAYEPTPAETASRLLPHLDQNITINTNRDINVLEVRVEQGPPMTLVGSLKNNTDHEIRVAEPVFDLTDISGSQLGAVTARVENLKAGSTVSFRLPIRQTDAAFALVREIHIQ